MTSIGNFFLLIVCLWLNGKKQGNSPQLQHKQPLPPPRSNLQNQGKTEVLLPMAPLTHTISLEKSVFC